MRNTKIWRILTVALILSLLMAVIPATPALAGDITIDPEEGEIGDRIDIVGEDFTASTSDTERFVDIYFALDDASTSDDIGTEVNTYKLVKTVRVGYEGDSDEGEIDTYFKVPVDMNDGDDDEDVAPGAHYIYVTRYGSLRIRAIADFTVIGGGEITLDPEDGPTGTEVEIEGIEFGDSEDFIIEYDGDEIDIESGDSDTDSNGEFISTVLIPESTAGDHTIKVLGEDSGAEPEATFTVEPTITLSPTEANANETITVSGTGFAGRSDITVYIDGTKLASDTTDSDGNFDVNFTVPAVASGSYDVEAFDEDDNEATAEFSIAATTVKLEPTTGNVGTPVAVTGNGYTPGGTIIIKYDDAQVTTATVQASGIFAVIFNTPASVSGEHVITVGDGTTTKQFTFTMESVAPPTPQPLLPQMEAKPKQPVRFDWADVTDDSSPATYTLQIATSNDFATNAMVLEKKGITKSEYTLTEAEQLESRTKEEPYYWRIRAVDAASNESAWTGAGEFYVGAPSITGAGGMPTWVLYTLIGLGGVLLVIIGFWLGRRTAYYSY
ncbi:MAG TPA: IPT/TIG domain-containing protein [Dehalococcoidales bacterium]|nr:IPT/TIG domain-containing protein [Dehalococcoidales bacterium]